MRLFLLAACILSAQLAPGVTLGWNPSPTPGVAGYRIYYGTSSGIYKGLLDAGNVTTTSVSGLAAGVTYYFTVVAYNANVVLSDFSNEISYTVPGGSTAAVDGSGGSGSGSTGGTTTNQPAGLSYVTSKSLGTLRNDFSGFVGMQILVGPAPITVTALGHLFVSGNSRTHTVKLVKASDGTDVPGGSVNILSSGTTGGQFQYATLSNPVVLSAGAAYYVMGSESSGGDAWYHNDTRLTTTSAAVELSSVYWYGVGQYYVNGAAGQSYGPVDFKYTTVTSSKSDRYVTSDVLGSLRSTFNGFVGMQILVGSTPIAVTGLGRMAAPGNGGTHLVKLVDASDGTDVPGGAVTVSMSGSFAGQFQYANLSSPALLLPGSAYYVLSQETATGDVWYNNDTIVHTTPVATEISSVWGYGLGQWYVNGDAGQSYGPVDLKYYTTNLPPPQRYLLGQTVGTARNDFSGFAGMRILVGPNPITVTALGRIVAGVNSGTHLVKLVKANSSSDIPGGSVTISTSGGTVGQFQYANLSSPIVLSPGQPYYLVSQETYGGDVWYSSDTVVNTTSVAAETCGIWGYGSGQWNLNGGSGQSYGPVDFKYSITPPPKPQRYLTSQDLGTVRNDFSGFVGMRILVGPNPITVTALGRIVAGGNTGTHIVKFVNANSSSDIQGGSVSVSTSGGTVGQFQYANLSSPIVLSAGQPYYLVSQETSGGDTWYHDDTVVNTTSVAAETSAIYGYGSGQWYMNGTTGQSYGPVDFKCLTNSP